MELKLLDVHSHLNDGQFGEDREEVIEKMKSAGIGTITVGTDREMSSHAVELAERHENLWATVGLHPTDNIEEGFDSGFYEELARHPKVVAIGECGLDFYRARREDVYDAQKEIFIKQIELSLKVNKPLMLHCRSSYEDVLGIIKSYPSARGNVHFFTGTWAVAQEFLKLGFTLSFPGVITFTHDYDEVVKNTPLDMIMTETDAPYAAPVPYRGKRNEPAYVEEVVKKIAELKGLSYDEVARATCANALKFVNMSER